MPVTVPDNLPSPVDTDTPDVPRDITALATATQAALVKKMANVTIGYCSLAISTFTLPSKGVWHQIPFNIVGGNHLEWGNVATGRITVPAAGVYSLQFTGAFSPGVGVVAVNVTSSGWGNGADLFLQEASHHADTGTAFYISSSNLWGLDAGNEVMVKAQAQQHSQATPAVWGTMIVARVEPLLV